MTSSSAGVTGYLKPYRLYQTLSVLSKTRAPDGYGGVTDTWSATGTSFSGVIVSANTRELMLAAQAQYPVTHTIVADGSPQAQVGQRLQTGSRLFQVQSVENPGELGLKTIYRVEER